MTAEEVGKMRYAKGRVVMPGTDVTTILVDDVIYYDSRQGFDMFIEGQLYSIIKIEDVIVVL